MEGITLRHFTLLALMALLTTQVLAQPLPSGGLPQGWEEPIMNHLRQTPGSPLDLETLGIEDPGQEVDLYGLYQDNKLQMVIGRFGGRDEESIPEEWHLPESEGAYTLRPLAVRAGKFVISSLNQVALVALSEVCSVEVRPTEFVLTAIGGFDFRAQFGGSVSLKFDLETVCPSVLQRLVAGGTNDGAGSE